MTTARRIPALLLGATLLACAGDTRTDTPPQTGTEAQAEPATNAPATIPGLPPGGLEDWIAEIRDGLATLPDRIASDIAGARTVALELYVGRQEFIEIFYGENGRLTAGGALGPAVEHAEEEFHELLLMLNGDETPDAEQVRAKVVALAEAYERVLEEARRAGVPLTPVATTPAGS